MSNTACTSAPTLTRFWLVTFCDAARVELSDGTQHLVTLRRGNLVTDLSLDEDDRDMLAWSIADNSTEDDRCAGEDASISAAEAAITESERLWARLGGEAA